MYGNTKYPRQNNPEKEEKTGGIILSNFRQYYKAKQSKQYGTGIKTHRSMEQDREPKNKLTLMVNQSMTRGNNTQRRKDSLFNSGAEKIRELNVKE